jgi:threonine synthase
MGVRLSCIDCKKTYEPTAISRCSCGGLLEVAVDYSTLKVTKKLFDTRLGSTQFPYGSGVWRFRELINPLISEKDIISRGEGNTYLYSHPKLSSYSGVSDLLLKHEGENPTGSFKDRGMTSGVSEAKRLGRETVACASTGNTSASMAAYASLAGLKPVVFIPEGMIAYGKLSQSIAYGARVLQVKGNFDDAMSLVQESSDELGMYLLNSINPWRIEGQKAIMFELVQQLSWETPDWVIVPAGNLGNTSAFGKAFKELSELGFISKIPQIAAIQAAGADPFYKTWKKNLSSLAAVDHPDTVATAIKIGNPVSWKKALSAIKYTKGVVESVTDQEIMDAKAVIDSAGVGCEPASAASVAGAKKLFSAGVIDKGDKVACIITGNILKDPDSTINYHLSKLSGITPKYPNKPTVIEATVEAVKAEVKQGCKST